MMTAPVTEILSRKLEIALENELNRITEGLEEAVNFGTQILNKGMKKGGTEADLPAVLFLRNMLENIDAITVLIRNGVIEPCNNLLRTALENLFSLEYLLADSGKITERSRSFLVWNFVTQEKWLSKADIGTPAYKEMEAKFKKDRLMKSAFPYFIDADDLGKEMSQKIFSLPGYQEVKQEYDRTKKIKKNPAWYSLYDGPGNLEQVASLLDLPALYEVLYRGWSPTTHGNNILQGKIEISKEGFAKIAPLRDPYPAASIAQHCMNICILSFRAFISWKVPEMGKEYDKWYQQIREFNLNLVPVPPKPGSV